MEVAVSDSPLPPVAGKPRYRPWVGVVLSLLISGAGMFLAGDRRSGVRWFVSLTALGLLCEVLAPLPAIPGLWNLVGLRGLGLLLSLVMLVRSWRRVPRLGWRKWLAILLCSVALGAAEFAAGTPFSRYFNISTNSMAPTVSKGDHIIVQRYAYWFAGPQRGEAVAFNTDGLPNPPVPPGLVFLKRVVALPGETIQIKHGHLWINGSEVTGPAVFRTADYFVPHGAPHLSDDTASLVVPAEEYFLIGDNTQNSLDSRHFGAVPRRNILGRATKIYWPYHRAGDLR